jgi:histidyl-tRNA synthetase
MENNPLRILDSKNPDTQALLAEAPSLLDFLGEDAMRHFSQLQDMLRGAGIEYRINPRLVRGLDYYNNTVFEWTTDKLGAQGTVCAGGRYDGLVQQLGGAPTPAVGFAMGIERLALLFESHGALPAELGQHIDVYFVVAGEGLEVKALAAAEALREAIPDMGLLLHSAGGSFKSQLKKADKSGASFALILGEDEASAGTLTLKALRGQSFGQQTLATDQLLHIMPTLLGAAAH